MITIFRQSRTHTHAYTDEASPRTLSRRSVIFGVLFAQEILYGSANGEGDEGSGKGDVEVEKAIDEIKRPWFCTV